VRATQVTSEVITKNRAQLQPDGPWAMTREDVPPSS